MFICVEGMNIDIHHHHHHHHQQQQQQQQQQEVQSRQAYLGPARLILVMNLGALQ